MDAGTVWAERLSPTETRTMANTDLTNVMELDLIAGMMAVYTVVAFMETSARERVCTCGLMEPDMKENSKMGNMMEQEHINLLMEVSILASGDRVNIMEWEVVHGQTVEFIQVNGTWDKHMDKEKKQIQMGQFVMMESGPMMHQ